MLFFTGHSERAMLYHELEDGMYSVTSYFFAKVSKLHYVSASGMTVVSMCVDLWNIAELHNRIAFFMNV